MRERQDQGPEVRSLRSDSGKIREFAGVEGLGIFQVVQHVGVFRREAWREHALKSVQEVRGGDGIAIGPPGVGAQVKRPRQAVAARPPFFRDAGNRVQIARIVGREALEKIHHDVEILLARRDVGIEVGRLAQIAPMEDLPLQAGLHGGLVFRAGGKAGQEQGEEQVGEESAGGHGGR